MVAASIRTHMDAVAAALEDAGLSVYKGKGPDSPGDAVPYVVLHVNSKFYDGPVSDAHADFEPAIQVKSVGDSHDQVLWTDDKATDVILYGTITPPAGRAWMGKPDHTLTTPTQPDEDLSPALFYLSSIFTLFSTPA